MQNDRTLRFWDNFYESQEPSSDKEWVLQPSEPLLQRISQCLEKKSSIRILEIGCGTSSLGRELWKHMRANPSVGEEEPSVHLLATDVSEICIRQNQERDSGLLDQVLEKGSIEYKVLDITEPHPELEGKFDFILDKCCLDTFLFRSRQRAGPQTYGKLIRCVIDNIHSWLCKEGVYVILSPRTKFKTVRDYVGFSSVERYELDPAELQRGYVEGKEAKPDCIFLYVCRKNPAYSPSTEEAFPCLHDHQQPQDEDSCQICGVTFVKFRNGEGLAGSRGAWWHRKWKGHIAHCKKFRIT
jgi:SAM-dependent methyltransferase